MEVSKKRLRQIEDLLEKNEIGRLSEKLYKWYPDTFEKPSSNLDRCDPEIIRVSKKISSCPEIIKKYINLYIPKYTELDLIKISNNWDNLSEVSIEDINEFLN